jgi:hypothetical protein
MTQQGLSMQDCVTIDDKTLFVHLLVISVFVWYSARTWNTYGNLKVYKAQKMCVYTEVTERNRVGGVITLLEFYPSSTKREYQPAKNLCRQGRLPCGYRFKRMIGPLEKNNRKWKCMRNVLRGMSDYFPSTQYRALKIAP